MKHPVTVNEPLGIDFNFNAMMIGGEIDGGESKSADFVQVTDHDMDISDSVSVPNVPTTDVNNEILATANATAEIID